MSLSLWIRGENKWVSSMKINKSIYLFVILLSGFAGVSEAKSQYNQNSGNNVETSTPLKSTNYFINSWANIINKLSSKPHSLFQNQSNDARHHSKNVTIHSAKKHTYIRIDFKHEASREDYMKNAAIVEHYSNIGKHAKIQDTKALLKAGTSALAVGKYGKAKKWLTQLVKIEEDKGEESLELADALHAMGMLHLDLGQYDKALPLFTRSLALKEKKLSIEAPSVADTQAKLGDLYKAKGMLRRAEEFYLKALSIHKKHTGLEDSAIADIWMELGDIYFQRGEYGKAEKYFLRSKSINTKSRGANHPIITRIDSKLAEIFTHNGDLEKGEDFYLKAVETAKQTLGENHTTVARAMKNLADFYKNNKHYRQAEHSYQETLKVATKVFGKKAPFVAEVVKSLSEVYESMGNFKKAEQLKKQLIQQYS